MLAGGLISSLTGSSTRDLRILFLHRITTGEIGADGKRYAGNLSVRLYPRDIHLCSNFACLSFVTLAIRNCGGRNRFGSTCRGYTCVSKITDDTSKGCSTTVNARSVIHGDRYRLIKLCRCIIALLSFFNLQRLIITKALEHRLRLRGKLQAVGILVPRLGWDSCKNHLGQVDAANGRTDTGNLVGIAQIIINRDVLGDSLRNIQKFIWIIECSLCLDLTKQS